MKVFVVMSTMVALAATETQAQQDPWFGRDKALHFVAGAAFAAGGYALGSVASDRRDRRIVFGISLGIGAGAAKELRDRKAAGDPSWRDFAWTAAGAVAGVGASWLIDRAGDGAGAPSAPAPRPLIAASGGAPP